jgi:hypothetical protein
MIPSLVRICAASTLAALVGAAACGPRGKERPGREGAMAGQTIEAVLQEHTGRLMALPGVVGTGIGECAGKPCIKVFVVRKTSELAAKIPASLRGYAVAVEETGEIRALDSS